MTTTTKSVKLSSAMRIAIRKMRGGDPLQTFFDIGNKHWVLAGDSFWDSTMKALFKRGIIVPSTNNGHGLQYYELSEFGKNIII